MGSVSDEIRIADRVIRIEEPNGWQFLQATEQLGLISAAVPDINQRLETYIDEYRLRHGRVLEKAVADVEFPAGEFPGGIGDKPEEWWAERGGQIVLPGPPPSGTEQAMVMFDPVLRAAKDPVIHLIAILSAPQGELATAEETGNLADYLEKWKRELLHGAKISTLAIILARSLAAMREEFAADGEAAAALGEIRTLFTGSPGTPTPSSSSDEPSAEGSSPTVSQPIPEPAAEPAASTARPDSSTASPPPTDGTAETPSTDPPGASYEPSPVASGSVS